MPKTKLQGVLFGILMSVTMAYGMEVYNIAWKMGYASMPGGLSNMTNDVFGAAALEAAYMCVFVFIFSNLWGNRVGHALAARLVNPQRDNAFFCTVVISCCTVLIMCPTMSLVASLLFNIGLGGQPLAQLPAIWVGTVLKNFPMALLWNLFAAGPLTRVLFRALMGLKERRSSSAFNAA